MSLPIGPLDGRKPPKTPSNKIPHVIILSIQSWNIITPAALFFRKSLSFKKKIKRPKWGLKRLNSSTPSSLPLIPKMPIKATLCLGIKSLTLAKNLQVSPAQEYPQEEDHRLCLVDFYINTTSKYVYACNMLWVNKIIKTWQQK